MCEWGADLAKSIGLNVASLSYGERAHATHIQELARAFAHGGVAALLPVVVEIETK